MDYIPQFLYSQFLVTPPYPTAAFADKTVIVTGSNTGLGLEVARHTRLNAAKVILAVRDQAKGEIAKADIEASTQRTGVLEIWELDQAHYASAQAFAERVSRELLRLDVVVLNAGMLAPPTLRLSEEGDEVTLTVNVLSTFLLWLLLLPKLKQTAEVHHVRPHMSILVSEMHHFAAFAEQYTAADQSIIAALNAPKQYKSLDRYSTTKAIQILLFRHLCDVIRQAEPDAEEKYPVVLNILNPGLCHSSFFRDNESFGISLMNWTMARSTEKGARTIVHAASAGSETWGEYLSDADVQPVAKWVSNPNGKELGRRLWYEFFERLQKVQPGIAQNI